MERFNYPSLAAARAESAEILQLLEYESWGYKKDEEEKLAELEAQAARGGE
jgi:hypothetical protein